MSEPSFAALGGVLSGLAVQQTDLQEKVKSGQLWMAEGVAEDAALHCEKAVGEIEDWLADTRDLVQRRKFGANEDGEAAAARYARAGQEYVQVMTEARNVFQRMADTYRAAGRTMTQADEAGQQPFGGGVL